jgi:hypothetical protein
VIVRIGYLIEQMKDKKKRMKFYGSVAGNALWNEIGRFARTRENRHADRTSVGNPGGRDHLEELGAHGRRILK